MSDQTPTDPKVEAVARAFSRNLKEALGLPALQGIDKLNHLPGHPPNTCCSHDFCDPNVYMDEAFHQVTGKHLSDFLPDAPYELSALWNEAWTFARKVGFARLSGSLIRGEPDDPIQQPFYTLTDGSILVTLPGLPPIADGWPLEIDADYWGRNPHLQILCRNHDDLEGASKVNVRYDQSGKVVEVLVTDPKIRVVRENGGGSSSYSEGFAPGPSPWEIERDANPPCAAGDKLRCPSGQIGDVMRLHDRYDGDLESFRNYAETYGILERLDGYPGSSPRHGVYDSVEQAWEVNPLTVGTTDPSDFSTVPQL